MVMRKKNWRGAHCESAEEEVFGRSVKVDGGG